MSPLPINTDTGVLSDLAREPTSVRSRAMLSVLEDGRGCLAISDMQLYELAAPELKPETYASVRDILRDVPVQLINPWEDVADEEVAYAVGRAVGSEVRPPRVFAASLREFGMWRVPPGESLPDFLDLMRSVPKPRQQIMAVADEVAAASMLKGAATLVHSPDLPLTLRVERHLTKWRSLVPGYGRGLTANELIAMAGGEAAFPFIATHLRIVQVRLLQAEQKSTRNDVWDEYIAAYSPYVPATIVDRPTMHRMREAGLPHVARVTARPEEVAGILERVAAGELSPVVQSYQQPF